MAFPNYVPIIPSDPPDFDPVSANQSYSSNSTDMTTIWATSEMQRINSSVTVSSSTIRTPNVTEQPISIKPCLHILFSSMGDSHIRYWDVALLVPNVLFLFFLLLRSRIAIVKLRQTNRPIFFTFYFLVFLVTTISIARAIVSMLVDASKTEGDVADTVLWVTVKFFLLAVELCVVIFGIGFSHLDSKYSIKIILLVTMLISLCYSVTQGFLELRMPDEHFIGPYDIYSHGGMLFWSISSFLFSLMYCTVLILPLTPIKEKIQLPTKRSFYVYVSTLAVLYLCQAIASAIIRADIEQGVCVTDVTSFLYFSLFAPLIYMTFLHNFFKTTKQQLLLSYAGPDDETDEVHHLPSPYVISKQDGTLANGTPYQSIYDSTEFLHSTPPQITGQLTFSVNADVEPRGSNSEGT